MNFAFYFSGGLAVLATALAITRLHPIHALLYLTVSLIAIAGVFYSLGATFVAALEVIIYAGAIMVLFIFVVMMLNLGRHTVVQEHAILSPRDWAGPVVLSALLMGEFVWLFARTPQSAGPALAVGPKAVGIAMYGPYAIAVELASLLLLGALVAAYHLGWRMPSTHTGAGASEEAAD